MECLSSRSFWLKKLKFKWKIWKTNIYLNSLIGGTYVIYLLTVSLTVVTQNGLRAVIPC